MARRAPAPRPGWPQRCCSARLVRRGAAQPAQVNTIKEVGCEARELLEAAAGLARQSRIDITVIVSFNRAGEILGHPEDHL